MQAGGSFRSKETDFETGRLTWHPFALLAIGALTLFARFFRPHTLFFFQDDFFYYAQVARNLALHGVSTFDGIHLTNGYHPLWLGLLTAFYYIFPASAFLVAVQVVSLAALLTFYFATKSFLQNFNIPPTTCRPAALLASVYALLLIRYGMEVTLTLPLGLCALLYVSSRTFAWSNRQTFLYGLLSCLTVLSRLDAILLFAVLIVAQILTAEASWPTRLKRLALYSLGYIPLLLYCGLNLRVFHTLMPISGEAKQLKPLFPLSSVPLHSLYPSNVARIAVIVPAVLALIAALIALATSKKASRDQRALLATLLLFPVVQVAALCLLSDWQMWPWYYYPFVFSSIASLTIALLPTASTSRPRNQQLALLTLTAFYAIYCCLYAVRKSEADLIPLENLTTFMDTHPGIYGMGDYAGYPGFRSHQPVIQLEGLMMDADYLKLLKAGNPLHDTLDRYHARYYVTRTASNTAACQHLAEAEQSGVHSPKMQGTVCAMPIAFFSSATLNIAVFDASAIK